MAELNWSDAQWQKVKDAVTETFHKASVASAFLPMYGPLPGSAEIVRNERLRRDDSSTPPTISLDGDYPDVNLKFANVTVRVELTSEQVADETLSNAVLAFKRAANILAQAQDRTVFEGFGRGPRGKDSTYIVNAVRQLTGLADFPARARVFRPFAGRGQALVRAVVNAVHRLEDNFNPGPFACVLGNGLYDRAYEPQVALTLPADRIIPLLKGGPLLRAGQMDTATGIVVSLAGQAVDLVVGTPPTVQFLQRTPDAKFLFRVYERFVLRIRDATNPPVAGFTVQAVANADAALFAAQRAGAAARAALANL